MFADDAAMFEAIGKISLVFLALAAALAIACAFRSAGWVSGLWLQKHAPAVLRKITCRLFRASVRPGSVFQKPSQSHNS